MKGTENYQPQQKYSKVRLSLFQFQWSVWSVGTYESKTPDYLSWHKKTSTGLLETAGEARRCWSEWEREAVGIFPLLFPICAFIELFSHSGSTSEGKRHDEFNQTAGSLWGEGQPAVFPEQCSRVSLWRVQLFSCVPSSQLVGELLVLLQGILPGGTHFIPHRRTRSPKLIWLQISALGSSEHYTATQSKSLKSKYKSPNTLNIHFRLCWFDCSIWNTWALIPKHLGQRETWKLIGIVTIKITSHKVIALEWLKWVYGKIFQDVCLSDSRCLGFSVVQWSWAASSYVWQVKLMIRAGHSWGKGQAPNLTQTHQFQLFFGHGLWPSPHSTFSQMPDPVSQGTRGQFLKEFTQIRYLCWKGHSKVRIYGQGSLVSFLSQRTI